MEGYDREIGRERGEMASAGQGTAGGSGGMGGMVGEAGGGGGPMVTIPSMSGGGAAGPGEAGGADSSGSMAGGGGSGGGGQGGPRSDGNDGEPGANPGSKSEIPEDIAEVTGKEDQVARQIREAAEQEEDKRIREALWDEYRKHMGLKSN